MLPIIFSRCAASLKEDCSPSPSWYQKSLRLRCEFETVWSWSCSPSSSCHQKSLRLRCEFKTVWWRQSTRRRSCGREWKCLQIGPNWDERQNWDILILSIQEYFFHNFVKNCSNWNFAPADKCSRSRQFSDKEVVGKVVHVTSPGLVRDLPMFPPPWPH